MCFWKSRSSLTLIGAGDTKYQVESSILDPAYARKKHVQNISMSCMMLSSDATLFIRCYSCHMLPLLSSDATLVIWCYSCHLKLLLSSAATLVIRWYSCHLRPCHLMLLLSSEATLVIWWCSCHLMLHLPFDAIDMWTLLQCERYHGGPMRESPRRRCYVLQNYPITNE